MIKIEHTAVMGWEATVRGMRNPLNSWERSDSGMMHDCETCPWSEADGMTCRRSDRNCEAMDTFVVGPKDLELMLSLAKAGPVHGKYRRMIMVSMDVTAPLYWWKEYDTYKVGTVTNSCSTMHKIAAKPFELADFSHEHLVSLWDENLEEADIPVVSGCPDCQFSPLGILEMTIDMLNKCRESYLVSLKTEEHTGIPAKDIWWQMIQLLPSSYNQKRTPMMSYEMLASIYRSQKNNKLDEWHEFCHWIEGLPYSEVITVSEDYRVIR